MHILRLLLVMTAIGGIARGQGVLLNAGDSWSWHFTTLDYVGTQVRQIRPVSAAFILIGTINQYPANFLYEAFEGVPPNGVLPASQIPFSGMECDILTNAWQDLEGAVRLTVTDGSFTLQSVTFHVARPNGSIPSSYDFYEAIVAAPEPSALALLLSALPLIWVCRGRAMANNNAPGEAGLRLSDFPCSAARRA
jgi:hypothetical protein